MVKTVTPSVLSIVINLIQYWIAFRLNILQRNFDKLKSWCRDLYSLKNTIEKKENKEFWKKILDCFICESHWLRCFRCRNLTQDLVGRGVRGDLSLRHQL